MSEAAPFRTCWTVQCVQYVQYVRVFCLHIVFIAPGSDVRGSPPPGLAGLQHLSGDDDSGTCVTVRSHFLP